MALDTSSILALTLTVFISSLLGSWHCAGMCGPIATIMNQKRLGVLPYHMGRLMSYTLAGAISGGMGRLFLLSHVNALRIFSVATLSALLILWGMSALFNLQLSFHSKLLNSIQSWGLRQSPFVVGSMSLFLPCGWLYSYIASASTLQSPFLGAYVLFVFWLGGIPALNSLPYLTKKFLSRAKTRERHIAGGILILAGLWSILSFVLSSR